MSSDESGSDKECPLCMEPFDLDDLNFYPCTCQYQICRFCWHRLRTDENGLCPACRQPYPENPVNYQPLSGSELQKIKSKSKMANKNGKMKTADCRKHLANYRVLQKNLVYVVGLSQKLAEVEVLKKQDFFGKFGRILKVVIGTAAILSGTNHQTSCTAYVTYAREEDALRAIEAVNNAVLDGRLLKASLGTTKYCSTFLRGQICHKLDCMYLHKIAEPDASFTKEDMHAGKHTEFERRLHEQLASRSAPTSKRRTTSGGEKAKTEKSGPELTTMTDIETNAFEVETNSSEPEMTSTNVELELIMEESMQQQQTTQPSVPTDDIPIYTSTNLNSVHSLSSSPTLTQLQTATQSQVPNKFTTCEEFERMLIMESKEAGTRPTSTAGQCNGTTAHVNFDDDLGFDPFSESIKGLADLVIEERECRKQQQLQQQQQTQPNFQFLFNRTLQAQQPQPIQRPTIVDTPRLYNSYVHQNTYIRYNQLRDYAKSALSAAGAWPIAPPPGLTAHASATAATNNGFFSQK